MIQRAAVAFVIATSLGLDLLSALAGPCGNEIAQFETAVRQSASNPNAGPIASQSIGAQLDRGCAKALARAQDMYNLQ